MFNFLLAPVFLLRELCSRYPQYTVQSTLRIAIGTYNVNGGKHFRSVAYKDVSLADWLLDSHKNFKEQCKKIFKTLGKNCTNLIMIFISSTNR